MAIDSRVISTDPETGLVELMHFDTDTDDITMETKVDVAPVIEWNKRLYNAESSSWKGEFHRVASIPMVLYHELQKQGIIDDEKRLKKWLNDPDNRFFRTRGGRV